MTSLNVQLDVPNRIMLSQLYRATVKNQVFELTLKILPQDFSINYEKWRRGNEQIRFIGTILQMNIPQEVSNV